MVMYVGPSGYTKDLRTLRLCLQDFGFDDLGPRVGGYGFRGCGASCLHFGCSATTHFVRANGVRGDHSDNCFHRPGGGTSWEVATALQDSPCFRQPS